MIHTYDPIRIRKKKDKNLVISEKKHIFAVEEN